ncbi:MAG: ABC transporter permease [Blastocatellia bacterium]
MDALLQDLHYSLRVLRRNARFSLMVALILALGIGAAVTMFTIVYQTVLNPLPFKNPDRLVVLVGAASPPAGDVLDWWTQDNTFDHLCFFQSGGVNLTEGDNPGRVVTAVATSSFFSVFGVQPQAGRGFSISEEQLGNNYVVIISDRLWTKLFDRAPGAIGQSITLSGISHKIIGVMPSGFNFPDSADIWVPGKANYLTVFGLGDQTEYPLQMKYMMVGRLRAGISLVQARDRLGALHNRLQEIVAKAGRSAGDGVNVIPLREFLVREFKQSFWMLFAGAGFLLLIACANAANLMLSRSLAREKEIAIRLCLGVGGPRLARQLLIESMLLAFAGSVAGIAISYWGIQFFRYFGAAKVPMLGNVHIDITTLSFAVLVSLVVGVVIGLIPAIQALSTKLTDSIKEGGMRSASGFHRRTRQALVIVEVALALALLAGSGLVIQSFFRLSGVAPGFDSRNVITLNVDLPAVKYWADQKKAEDSPSPASAPSSRISRIADFHRQLLESIRRLPGVVSVGGITRLPLGGAGILRLWIESPGADGGMAMYTHTTGDYFQTMGIPVLRGRLFTESDSENTRKVALVNETLAKRLWGSKDPVGQLLALDGESDGREVVGCVGDVKYRGLAMKAEPELYLPYLQPLRLRNAPREITLVVRTHSDPKSLIPVLRSQVSSIDNGVPIFRVRTLQEVIGNSTADYRFRGTLLGSFALLSLIMAIVGVYGVISYSVVSRTHEVGIRMSLGATPRSILLMVLQEGANLVFIGLLTGFIALLGLSRLLSNLLYGIGQNDPLTLAISALSIVLGSLIACIYPALTASKIDPALALRHE